MDKIIFEKVGSRLKEARELRKITLEEAGKKVDVHKSTILRWERGETEKIKLPVLQVLAKFYNVNPSWLLGYDVPMEGNFANVSTGHEEKQAFPLLGTVKAGYDYLASENIIGYVNIDKKLSDPENYFALRVTGDSMQPVLYEDDIIIVHRQSDVENGQIGILLIDSEEATVKKVIKYDNHIELVALNQYYPPRKLTKKDKFQIIGKVTEARISKIFE